MEKNRATIDATIVRSAHELALMLLPLSTLKKPRYDSQEWCRRGPCFWSMRLSGWKYSLDKVLVDFKIQGVPDAPPLAINIDSVTTRILMRLFARSSFRFTATERTAPT